MITKQDVYVAYRKAQSVAMSRGYRLPKDWDTFYKRMSLKNRNALTQVTHWLNTKWKDIDSETYFACGFELFKTFSYHQFSHPTVIRLYIQKDKNIKREARINKEQMQDSAMFVKRFMRDWMIRSFHIYCNSRVGNRLIPVTHYLENRIDAFFLTWLIKDRLILLNDDERSVMPYITEKYRENVLKLEQIQTFLTKLRRLL